MRQVTATEKLRAVNEGMMAKTEFVRQMRQSYPMYISQYNQFDDTVQILKNRGMLFEEYKNPSKNLSDDSIRRGLDYELTSMGLDPVTCTDSEAIGKAKAKATANIEKDPLHYYNLLSNESSKVDKNDQPKETKRGALEKDTFNDMKKATLKERKERLVEGTRALVGFLSGDRLTTTYNHYDGYPSNLGKGLEAHYNDDDAAKDIAMKGYITGMDPDTGEITQTHKDAPGKVILPDDAEQRAREIGEEIDKFGAEYGYIWDDESNKWITIKNTGIRSMIDQIMDKMAMVNVHSGETMEGDLEETEEEYLEKRDAAIKQAMGKEELGEIDSTLDPYEDKKVIVQQVIDLLKTEKGAGNKDIKDFIKTHYEDIINLRDDQAILDEFEQFLSVNTDYVDETDAYDSDDDTQDMIDKMRKDGKDSDDFVDEKKIKEDFAPSPNSDVPDANAEEFDIATAFEKARVDMSKPVTVFFTYGSATYGGDEKDEMSAEAAIKKLEAERQDRSKQYTDDGEEVPEDHHAYEFENSSVLEEDMPEGHEYKLAYFQTGDAEWAITQEKSGVSEKKLNEEGVEDANYPVIKAFKKYGIDLSRDVIVAEMDGGTPQYGGGQLDIGDPEPAMVVAKRLEQYRLDTIHEYESEDQMRDFPVMYEDGFYGDYTPEGTEHKLTYSEDEGTMWDIFQAPSGVSEKKGKDHDGEIISYIADTYIQNAKDGDKAYAEFRDLNIRDAVQDVVGILQDPKHPLHGETKKEYQIVSRDKARGLFEKKGKDHDGDGDIDGDDYMAAKDKAIKKATGKDVNEALTVSGNSEEEIKKNAEELLALAKKVGLDKAEIKYSDNGNVHGVELNDKVEDRNAGKTRKVSDLQDKQYQAAKAARPKDGKPSFKAKKLKKLTVGGKTYEKGESDPNDDGRIMSIEKYPNGYFISGGVYSDYGDGDGPKEGYGYAIDLKGKEMDEEDLEGMYEGKKPASKKPNVNEAVKNIIQKVLEEQVLNEAATQELAKIADEYDSFDGLKPAVIALENVVTEIESFYDKTRAKIQKIYNDLGEVKNEEGLKVGAFITPSIENAFKRDLRPIIKNQFHGGLEMPKVKRISQADVDRGYIQQEAPKQTVYSPVNENVDIKGIKKKVKGPEAGAIFKKAKELLDNGDAEGMRDALNNAATAYYMVYSQDDNEYGIKVAKYIMRSTDKPGTKHRTVTPGKEKKAKKQSFDINGIRNAVEGPEANAIFKTAKKYLKDRDAKDMRDALDMAADEYYEFYDRKDNEDGKEVAKYIMSSLRK